MPDSIKKGSLTINSENIFPIIKKWLYSDHDIFYRELVSNACDAITKRRKLSLAGECALPDDYAPAVHIVLDPEKKTVSVSDNGLGMTAEEVDSYINQIAFSGAVDFLEKYKDKANEDQIIGHFGLGFYSCFMVASSVEIETLSWQEGAAPVHWKSEGGQDFEMTAGTRTETGTTVTLHLAEDCYEFSNEYRAREILQKYCSFMPVPIWLDPGRKEDTSSPIDTDALEEGKEPKEKPEEKPINDTAPLWNKHPNECTEDDYRAFYRKVFYDFKEPLFWIHLNMDYPFNLKGILYFPKINNEYESIEGVIKLYNNQVFVADNIKEVIPEYFMLLKGVIDCPDLPLNVSRSALQNDGFVKKISDYIAKKVADKLSGMCKTDREAYEACWDDISPFVKYGCIRDEKFLERMKDYVLYKDIHGKYQTLEDLLKENEKDHPNTVFYVTDEKAQHTYIQLFKEQGLNAVILPHRIDSAFLQQTESRTEGLKFQSIDADLTPGLTEETFSDEDKATFDAICTFVKDTVGKDYLTVTAQALKGNAPAAVLTVSEDARRVQEMMRAYAGMGLGEDQMPPVPETLVLNASHPLVQSLKDHPKKKHAADIARQLYDLARLAAGALSAEETADFVKRSQDLIAKLI
ncbi:MAG: molecular chaperone HtpG [Lachnospiraceae bacterium]|nr:molecular chaperone HtpG [Lachnospiraceae bacterium]